jgi:hypothetical protein
MVRRVSSGRRLPSGPPRLWSSRPAGPSLANRFCQAYGVCLDRPTRAAKSAAGRPLRCQASSSSSRCSAVRAGVGPASLGTRRRPRRGWPRRGKAPRARPGKWSGASAWPAAAWSAASAGPSAGGSGACGEAAAGCAAASAPPGLRYGRGTPRGGRRRLCRGGRGHRPGGRLSLGDGGRYRERVGHTNLLWWVCPTGWEEVIPLPIYGQKEVSIPGRGTPAMRFRSSRRGR